MGMTTTTATTADPMSSLVEWLERTGARLVKEAMANGATEAEARRAAEEALLAHARGMS